MERIPAGCAPKGGAKLIGDRLAQENFELEGRGLASWEEGMIGNKVFTSPFYKG